MNNCLKKICFQKSQKFKMEGEHGMTGRWMVEIMKIPYHETVKILIKFKKKL